MRMSRRSRMGRWRMGRSFRKRKWGLVCRVRIVFRDRFRLLGGNKF